ncbi:MAG TPA: dephospho-CoA kinase [Gemmatales bacterium]|nr:dephospho-CoA kinase [Gemmatales bacterium]
MGESIRKTVPVLGIVGGIGSGKSYISGLFAQRGAHVIDADQLGHQALLDPAIKRQIHLRWGEDVFTPSGEVDRKKLGHVVFRDPREKVALESLVFPFIRKGMEGQIHEASQDPRVKLVILDAAILLETGWKDVCQAVIFVEADEQVRLQRVASRGWDAAELHRREDSQWPLASKRAHCQHIIPNNGDEVSTAHLVNELYSRYARL